MSDRIPHSPTHLQSAIRARKRETWREFLVDHSGSTKDLWATYKRLTKPTRVDKLTFLTTESGNTVEEPSKISDLLFQKFFQSNPNIEPRRNYVLDAPPLFPRGQQLKHRSAVLYLGIWIDETLSWSPQVHSAAGKVRTRLEWIRRMTGPTWGMLPEAVGKLVSRVLEPAAYYGAEVWQAVAYNERKLAPLRKSCDKPVCFCQAHSELLHAPRPTRLPGSPQHNRSSNKHSILIQDEDTAKKQARCSAYSEQGARRANATAELLGPAFKDRCL